MIICCGEALIDMLPRQSSDGDDVFLPVPGGAIFNTAIGLGRLGEPAGFVSGLSTDMFGDQLVEALQHSRVDTSLAIRSDRPTTLAFVRLTDGHATYSFFDENSAGRMVRVEDLPDLPDGVEALHFGAISLIPEPCGSAYEALMQRHAGDAVISLDPNIRPGFITDEMAHRARMERMVALSDIVKVSDEDLDWLAPDRSAEETIKAWLAEGCAIVLITRGAEGVDVHTRQSAFQVAARKVDVVDTVGAGDTFNAGLLAGLRRAGHLKKIALATISEQNLRPAVDLAVRVAAHVVGQAGANPPWQEELDADT